MDVLSMTVKYRENLLKFIKPILSDRSYIWVRNLISDINHKIISADTDYIAAQAILMYRNIIPFFKTYCTELTPSSILFTLYSCAIELNIRKLGDEVEAYDDFQMDIDMEDWPYVTAENIKYFDIRTAQLMIRQQVTGEVDEEIWAGGLCSLQIMDFM